MDTDNVKDNTQQSLCDGTAGCQQELVDNVADDCHISVEQQITPQPISLSQLGSSSQQGLASDDLQEGSPSRPLHCRSSLSQQHGSRIVQELKDDLPGSCDKCTDEISSTGVAYCQTCDLSLCDQHKMNHDSWFGDIHEIISAEVYKIAAKRYRKKYCAEHGAFELSLVCLKCQLIACLLCDLASECSGEVGHQLIAVKKLEEAMKSKYSMLLERLSAKLNDITELQNSTWLNFEQLVSRSKELINEVDKSVNEQIEEIKRKASDVHFEISGYVSQRRNQVEEFVAQLKSKQEHMSDLMKSLSKFDVESHITDRIKDYERQSHIVKEAVNVELGECVLSEKHVQLKAHNRQLEIAICPVPTKLKLETIYKSTSLKGDCETVAYLGKDKFVAGYANGLEVVAKSAGGSFVGRFTANSNSDIESVARHPEAMIIALCAEEETMSVKYFAYPSLAFVKDVCSFWRNGNSYSHLAVTRSKELIITDDANNQLRVYGLEGRELYVIPLSTVPAYSSVHCQSDNSILVSECSNVGSVSRYKLSDSKAELIWCCGNLQNPTAICTTESGLIFVGSEVKKEITIISPSGYKIGELVLSELVTPGIWDLSLYKDQLAVATSEQVQIYSLC